VLKLLAVLALATAGMVAAQTALQNAPEKRPAPTTANVRSSSSTAQSAASTEQENLDIQRKLERFTGGLVIVGLMQVFTVFWQAIVLRQTLKEIHTQAEHMKQQIGEMKAQTAVAKTSAEAALLNAEALINVERPWLLENIARVRGSDHEWIVSIRNAGNTPAEVVDGYWSFSPLSGDFKLPGDYRRSIFLLQNTVIVKKDSFEVARIDTRLYHDRAIGGFRGPDGGGEFKLLYFHGDLEYWDTFANRSRPAAKPHVTQWCYVYNPETKEFTRAACTYHGHS
jgi:hypothetical protein